MFSMEKTLFNQYSISITYSQGLLYFANIALTISYCVEHYESFLVVNTFERKNVLLGSILAKILMNSLLSYFWFYIS